MLCRPEPEAEYAAKRFSTRRDDRTDSDKWVDDATLRGKVGTKRANRVIEAIDEIKSVR